MSNILQIELGDNPSYEPKFSTNDDDLFLQQKFCGSQFWYRS